jgi:flavodoxin
MKTLVIYDTNFGNTKIVAEAIAKGCGNQTKAVPVTKLSKDDLNQVTHIVVGSPIYQWKPTENMIKWLSSLKDNQLVGFKATTFDTRVKLFIHGDAANKIASTLEKAGARLIASPQVFFVKGAQGPLISGEIEKATKWGEELSHL